MGSCDLVNQNDLVHKSESQLKMDVAVNIMRQEGQCYCWGHGGGTTFHEKNCPMNVFLAAIAPKQACMECAIRESGEKPDLCDVCYEETIPSVHSLVLWRANPRVLPNYDGVIESMLLAGLDICGKKCYNAYHPAAPADQHWFCGKDITPTADDNIIEECCVEV